MEEAVIALPWQVQLSLGAGYAAYMLAYMGIREHHKSSDVVFRSIIFGLVTLGVFALVPAWEARYQIGVAIGVTLLSGLVWRVVGIGLMRGTMRQFNISWADDRPSAWTAVAIENASHTLSQISIELDDGTWFHCADTSMFGQSPYGPCTLGLNGDIALYVTSEEAPDGTVLDHPGTLNGDWGDRITFVPVGKIRRVAMRLK